MSIDIGNMSPEQLETALQLIQLFMQTLTDAGIDATSSLNITINQTP